MQRTYVNLTDLVKSFPEYVRYMLRSLVQNFDFSVSFHVPLFPIFFSKQIAIPTSTKYLLAKFGFDPAESQPAENEHCKVCPLSVYRSPRFTLRKRLHRLHRMGARRSRYYLICSALISAPNRFKFHEISSELQ